MKLTEWNEVVKYAKNKCEIYSKKKESDFQVVTYSMYDGRKGIEIRIIDYDGKVFSHCFTGVIGCLEEGIEKINMAINKVSDKI